MEKVDDSSGWEYQSRTQSLNVHFRSIAIDTFRSDADLCPRLSVISTGRRNTGGQLAINNDDGLPNARPIAFSEPLRSQLSHNAIFSVALVPPRNL